MTTFGRAVAQDIPIATDKRIRGFIHNPNEIQEVHLHHNFQSYIEFSVLESIKVIAIGDNSSWNIVTTGNKMFIRPVVTDSKTNLTVVTNKNTYMMDLVALSDTEIDSVDYVLRFFHPSPQDNFGGDEVELLTEKMKKNSTGKKHYNYELRGSSSIYPSKIYDDGEITFFEFGSIIPKVFIAKEDGSEYASEMLSDQGLFFIKGKHEKLILHYQDKRAEAIRGS